MMSLRLMTMMVKLVIITFLIGIHDVNSIPQHTLLTTQDLSLGYTPCYKQFLPGLEEPEKSADAEKSEILR